ncbi:uncharacterized protein MEPE_02990 [Melanopsichium pennsylvanicum]|uniref:Uncharacterized protein n=1 Tax=Melanopsichium pennsylvanicum TaxID=63383 RepID=A0AAJ4XLY8_9BASI|nr:uncharacterized protein MEPE_02990 [Melanopsichium pennsylvanicum]
MTSIDSESAISFLNHLHCCVCFRSFASSSYGPSTALDIVASGTKDPFWMGEALPFCLLDGVSASMMVEIDTDFVLMREDETGAAATVPTLFPDQIQATCPVCSSTQQMVMLRSNQVPDIVRRLLQPFETSMKDVVNSYQYQFQHMSELITFLKAQALRQKQVLDHVKEELRQARKLKGELEEARSENRALKEKVRVLQSLQASLPSAASGSSTQHKPSPTANDAMADGEGAFLQAPRPFAFRNEQTRTHPLPTQTSADLAIYAKQQAVNSSFHVLLGGIRVQAAAVIFPRDGAWDSRHKVPGSSRLERYRGQLQASVPLVRPLPQPEPRSPFVKHFASATQRHTPNSSPGFGRSNHAQSKYSGSRSFPTLTRDARQLPHMAQSNSRALARSANFESRASPYPAVSSSIAHTGDGTNVSQDVAMPQEQQIKAER